MASLKKPASDWIKLSRGETAAIPMTVKMATDQENTKYGAVFPRPHEDVIGHEKASKI